MAATPKKIFVGKPTTSEVVVYTVPSNTKTILKNLVITNTTDIESNVNIKIGSFDIISSYIVQPRSVVTLDLSTVIEPGDTVSLKQSTVGAINVFISGVEVL